MWAMWAMLERMMTTGFYDKIRWEKRSRFTSSPKLPFVGTVVLVFRGFADSAP